MLERKCVFLLTAGGIHCPIVYWGDVWAEMILSSPVCTQWTFMWCCVHVFPLSNVDDASPCNVAGCIPKPVMYKAHMHVRKSQ